MYNIYFFLGPNLRFALLFHRDDDVQQCTWDGEMKYNIIIYVLV